MNRRTNYGSILVYDRKCVIILFMSQVMNVSFLVYMYEFNNSLDVYHIIPTVLITTY